MIDHLGPITATVEDNALLLECIAGSDPLDRRTAGTPPPDDYRAALGTHIGGLSIGVVAEGFGHRGSMAEVDATVRRASAEFARLGAKVETIALPPHRDGLAIWLVFAMEGYFGNLIRGNGFGGNYDGLQWSGLNDGIARWRDNPDGLPANLKLGMLMGEDAGSRYRHHYFVKARCAHRPKTAHWSTTYCVDNSNNIAVKPFRPGLMDGTARRERRVRGRFQFAGFLGPVLDEYRLSAGDLHCRSTGAEAGQLCRSEYARRLRASLAQQSVTSRGRPII